jgi:transcriptional regulator with XRE-family HTH domain
MRYFTAVFTGAEYPHAELGAFIRSNRMGANLSRARLSKLTGISHRRIVEIEKGANTTVSSLKSIMAALRLTMVPLGAGDTATLAEARFAPRAVLDLAEVLEEANGGVGAVVESLRGFVRRPV